MVKDCSIVLVSFFFEEIMFLTWMQDGITWLLNPPDQSLAYILADNGFDVWVANSRGTKHSLGHVTLSSNDPVINLPYSNWQNFTIFLSKFDACISWLCRHIGIGHGMNWWHMIFQQQSNMCIIKLANRRCIMLGIHRWNITDYLSTFNVDHHCFDLFPKSEGLILKQLI